MRQELALEIGCFLEVQRQEAAASSASPGRAPESCPGQARGSSLSRRPG